MKDDSQGRVQLSAAHLQQRLGGVGHRQTGPRGSDLIRQGGRRGSSADENGRMGGWRSSLSCLLLPVAQDDLAHKVAACIG
jgi:hypothetical protein